jgi:hypothetical protein
MRRCVTSILHMLLLLIVIEPDHGNVAGFLESDDKNRMLKECECRKEKQMAFCPPRLRRGVSLRDGGLIALAAYH